jgi:hypothetical protein
LNESDRAGHYKISGGLPAVALAIGRRRPLGIELEKSGNYQRR